MSDLPLLFKALSFAAKYHSGQKRKGASGEPYINHPIAVARFLAEVGQVRDVNLLCAALLHDTIEDTEATESLLRENFSDTITNIVIEVTDDKSLPKAERKRQQVAHAPTLSDSARLLKLADKTNNLGDLKDTPPQGWDVERIRRYFDWAEEVVSQVRGLNPAMDAAYDRIAAQKP
mgnify:CR=1 FL=1